jgi:hypothetical protein
VRQSFGAQKEDRDDTDHEEFVDREPEHAVRLTLIHPIATYAGEDPRSRTCQTQN